jgi:drug/metabolite transporter (DMT)-like permease
MRTGTTDTAHNVSDALTTRGESHQLSPAGYATAALPDRTNKPRPSEDVPKGIICMICATLGFAIMHATSKWLIAKYPIGEVMFSRSFISVFVCSAVVLPTRGFSPFGTKRARDHVLRGASQALSQTFSVMAFALMPLANAIAINFSAPLWAGLLAILWLRERPGFARCATLLLGFVGVLVVAHIGTTSLTLGALFALLNAIMVGTVTMAVRGMTATESIETLLVWQLLVIAALQGLLLPFGLKWPTGFDSALMIGSGLIHLASQYLWTKALALAPATAVSPFFYFMLVWASFIGFMIWDEIPTLQTLIGSCIVVVSGLLLLYYEAQSRRQVPS